MSVNTILKSKPARMGGDTKNGVCPKCKRVFAVKVQLWPVYQLGKVKCMECSRPSATLRRWTKAQYQDYLKTEHWKMRRLKALKRAGHRCALCASEKFLQVHHNNYERLGGELDFDLVVLCGDCHEDVHAMLKARGV